MKIILKKGYDRSFLCILSYEIKYSCDLNPDIRNLSADTDIIQFIHGYP
jgi:hypothetical protein